MSEYIIAHCVDSVSGVRYDERREEIVRCRDCAYIFHRKYNNGYEYQTCSYFDSEFAEVELNGFCKWGERRNDEISHMQTRYAI